MKKLLIAIVEDDLDDREFICSAFADIPNNIEIIAFGGAEDFFSFLKINSGLPDLVVTDLRMPIVSGFDVIRHIKAYEATKNMMVIVLSTSSNAEDIEKAKSLGAAAYFIKPYNLKGYEEIKSRILESFRLNSLSFIAVVEKLSEKFHFLLSNISTLTTD